MPTGSSAEAGRGRPRGAPRRAWRTAGLLAPLLLLVAAGARAGWPVLPLPPIPKAEIGEIRVITRNVFDPSIPAESSWPFRLVNAIHITTRPNFLRSAVPLEPGQLVSLEDLREAERIVRRFGFLRFVEIRPVPRPDGKIDIEVETRDAWTTKVGLSLGGGGGETEYSIGVGENNLFGLGKSLEFEFEDDGIRTTQSLTYEDPRFLSRDLELKLVYLDTGEGDGYSIELEKPLLRGSDPFGWAGEGIHITEELPIFHEGEEASTVSRKTVAFAAEATWTLRGSAVETLRAGLSFEPRRETFEWVEPGYPGELPADVHRADIVVFARSRELRFRSEAYINRFARVEDIQTGLDAELRLGVSPEFLAGDETAFLLGGHLGGGFETFGGNFGTAKVEADIRSGDDPANETGRVESEAVGYFRVPGPGHPLAVAHAQLNWGWNLPPHERFLLGGESGLRGYEARAFDGERLALVNLEYRLTFEKEWLSLVQLGFVGFFDAGLARDRDIFEIPDWRSSVGLGLRFGIPRAARNNVLRLDVAWPFSTDAQGNRGWVVSFGSGQAF